MKDRRFSLMAALVVLALVAGACSAGGGNDQPQTVSVSLTEWAISPSIITVESGRPISFEVTNAGEAPHTFGVKTDSGTIETPQIQPGAKATLDVEALDAGSYEVLCTLPGHAEQGMKGTLEVAAGAAGEGEAAAAHGSMSGAEMAAGHERGVTEFVKAVTEGKPLTEGVGGRPLKPTMDGGVKVFDITANEVQWEVAPGESKTAMTYNGTVPGPELRVHPGDRIRVVLHNELSQPTTIHFHGMRVPNAMDGVPYVTQDPVMPGGDFTYEFTVRNDPGTYLYHTHFNADEQMQAGLYAPIIVKPRGKVAWEQEYTMVIGDGALGYNLNGKSFPATAPLVAKKGETVLLHLTNTGSALHPMHLHGYNFTVIGQDGTAVPAPYKINTLVVAPGSTYDVLIDADIPGVWAFHCHILSHVERPDGMFGMVTALIVQ